MSKARPVVAVSACLLGQRVRYDGSDKRNETIMGSLAEQFDYLPFCPEVGIGMPVPRPPIELVQQDDGVHVLGVDDRSVDVTQSLRDYGRKMALSFTEVDGVIFKCRSPSCGLGSVPLHDQDGVAIGTTTGAFAGEIVTAMPDLPLVEEEDLTDPQRYNDFLRHLMNRHASR